MSKITRLVEKLRYCAIRNTGVSTGLEVSKEWLSVQGSTTRNTHSIADGQRVLVDGDFVVGGYLAPYPGHHSLPAGERCNCQCTVISAFGVDQIVNNGFELTEEENQTIQT